MAEATIAALAAWVATAVINYAVSYVMRGMQAERAQKKQLKRTIAALQDRTQQLRDSIVTRNLILGRGRSTGPIACWFTWSRNFNGRKDTHSFAIVLAGHECDGIERYMVNDEPIDIDVDGWVTTPKWQHQEAFTEIEYPIFDASGNFTLKYTPIIQGAQRLYVPTGTGGGSGVAGGGAPTDEQYIATTVVGNVLKCPDAVLPVFEIPGTGTYSIPGAAITYEWLDTRPIFRMRGYLGAPGQQAAPELIYAAAQSGNPTQWTSAHKATGVAYFTVEMLAGIDELGDIGLPNFSAVVRGAKAYDPRTGLTAWTQNPALLARWFMVDSGFAPACSADEIGEAELIASANVCDETVDFGTFQGPRYQANGQLFSEASPLENLEHICDAMDGEVLWVGGRQQIRAGYHDPATSTIDESCLDGSPIVVSPAAPRDRLFNTVAGTFADAANNYQRNSFPAVRVEAYVTEDGGEELQQLIDFAVVDNAVRCQMIAWQRLQRARQQLSVQLGTNTKAYDLWPTKNVLLSLAEFGFVSKEMRVGKRTFGGATLAYSLQETGPEIWNWLAAYATNPVAVTVPDTALPDTRGVPTIDQLQVFSGTAALLRASDGTVISRIGLSWTPVTLASVADGGHIEWQYRRIEEEQWSAAPQLAGTAASCFIGPVQDGAWYVLQGRCITSGGRSGARTFTTVQVIGKTEPPSAVTQVQAAADRVDFVPPADVDLAGVQVRAIAGATANWALGTPLHVGVAPKVSPFMFSTQLLGVQTIMVAGADTSGNVGAAGSSTFDFGLPAADNIVDAYDYGANGWPGNITGGTAGVTIAANADAAPDFWAVGGEDWWGRAGAADFWTPDFFQALSYQFDYTPPYGNANLTLATTMAGAGMAIEYRSGVSASTADWWAGPAGDAADFWGGSGNFWGALDAWQAWPGFITTQAGKAVSFRLSAAAGALQGVISQAKAMSSMPDVAQEFVGMAVAAGGSYADPALGSPPRSWVLVKTVQVTAINDGSGAVTGRHFAPIDPALGPKVEAIDIAGISIAGTVNVSIKGVSQ